MIITQTVEIPADRRITIEVPREVPTGKARAALTLMHCENPEKPIEVEWVNPLLGLAEKMGCTLTVERFHETQREEIKRENENDRRLWDDK